MPQASKLSRTVYDRCVPENGEEDRPEYIRETKTIISLRTGHKGDASIKAQGGAIQR